MNPNYKSIKSFEDACKAEGLDAASLLETWTKLGLTKDELAYKKLKIFVKAINGEWTPKMGDNSQRKYFAWFYVNAAGSGFSDSFYADGDARTFVGSRLCFESSEQTLHAIKYGEQMYIDFLL